MTQTMTQDPDVKALVLQSQATDLDNTPAMIGGMGALTPVQQQNEIVPIKPSYLTKEEDEVIGKKSYEFLEMVRSDAHNWKLGDVIFGLGKEAMDATNLKVGLYERKMSDVLADVTSDSPIGNDILSVKTQLDLINPVVLSNKEITVTEKLWRLIPRSVTRLPKADEVLRMIAEKRETVMSVVNGLQQHLWEQKDQVIMDAQDLGLISDQLKDIQPMLQRDIYMGQLIWKALMEHSASITDNLSREAVQQLSTDLAMGVVDLQTIDNLNLQSRFGAEQLIRNSRITVRVVERTCTVLRGSVANALAVRAAAAQQARTMQQASVVQDAIAQTMADTATEIGQHMIKSAEMSQKMVVSTEKIEAACNQYEETLVAYLAICSETEKIAAQSSNRLSTINEKFRIRTDALTGSRSK